jgi:hypothetical protein
MFKVMLEPSSYEYYFRKRENILPFLDVMAKNYDKDRTGQSLIDDDIADIQEIVFND